MEIYSLVYSCKLIEAENFKIFPCTKGKEKKKWGDNLSLNFSIFSFSQNSILQQCYFDVFVIAYIFSKLNVLVCLMLLPCIATFCLHSGWL